MLVIEEYAFFLIACWLLRQDRCLALIESIQLLQNMKFLITFTAVMPWFNKKMSVKMQKIHFTALLF